MRVFRAWDKKYSKMYQMANLSLNNCQWTFKREFDNNKSRIIILPHPEIIVMEYIGANDIDGNMVFVGDILEFLDCSSCEICGIHEICGSEYYVSPYEVVYIDGAYIRRSSPEIKKNDYDNNPFETYLVGRDRIIGNIYESPEKLKILKPATHKNGTNQNNS